jgi:hypothetical protein
VKLKNDNIYDTILLFLEAVLLQLVLIPWIRDLYSF